MKTEELDYSCLDERDFLNIVIQRSEVLHDVKSPGKLVNAWSDGDELGLLKVVREKGSELAQRSYSLISNEFDDISKALGDWVPRSVADIGCGYGFFSLLAARAFQSDVTLIDAEENDYRHFGFSDDGAAYSSLQRAVEFLKSNGADNVDILPINPVETDVTSTGQVELAVSLLACGFHFSVDSYIPFFENNVSPGGKIILDIRRRSFDPQTKALSHLGDIEVINDSWKNRSRIIVTKPS